MSKVLGKIATKCRDRINLVYNQSEESKYIKDLDTCLAPSRTLVVWLLGAAEGKLPPIACLIVVQYIFIKIAQGTGYALHKLVQCLFAVYILRLAYIMVLQCYIKRAVDKIKDDAGYSEAVSAVAQVAYAVRCLIKVQVNQINECSKKAVLENILVFGALLFITKLFSLPTLLILAFIGEIGLIFVILVKRNPKMAKLVNNISKNVKSQIKNAQQRQKQKQQSIASIPTPESKPVQQSSLNNELEPKQSTQQPVQNEKSESSSDSDSEPSSKKTSIKQSAEEKNDEEEKHVAETQDENQQDENVIHDSKSSTQSEQHPEPEQEKDQAQQEDAKKDETSSDSTSNKEASN